MIRRTYTRIIPKREEKDCVVVAIAEYLGLSYEEVLAAFRHPVAFKGASQRQAQNAMNRLGAKTRSRERVDLEEDTGLLIVGQEDLDYNHVVFLDQGRIFDDNTVWDADVYIATRKATLLGLVYLVEATS